MNDHAVKLSTLKPNGACEQLGRKCRAIEISSGYVAVALQRFKDATGKQPSLVEDRNHK